VGLDAYQGLSELVKERFRETFCPHERTTPVGLLPQLGVRPVSIKIDQASLPIKIQGLREPACPGPGGKVGFTAALLRRDAYAREHPGPCGTCGRPDGVDVPRAGTGSSRVYSLG
jgi:hypothetical protein